MEETKFNIRTLLRNCGFWNFSNWLRGNTESCDETWIHNNYIISISFKENTKRNIEYIMLGSNNKIELTNNKMNSINVCLEEFKKLRWNINLNTPSTQEQDLINLTQKQ